MTPARPLHFGSGSLISPGRRSSTFDVRSRRTRPAFASPDHAAEQVSESFSHCVLQHRLVQTQIRYQLLEMTRLVLELFQSAHFSHAHAEVLFLPPVERLLADLPLSADVRHCNTALRLPKRERNLFFRESLPFHPDWPPNRGRNLPDLLTFGLDQDSGLRAQKRIIGRLFPVVRHRRTDTAGKTLLWPTPHASPCECREYTPPHRQASSAWRSSNPVPMYTRSFAVRRLHLPSRCLRRRS